MRNRRLPLVLLLLFAWSTVARAELDFGIYSGSFDPVHRAHLDHMKSILDHEGARHLVVMVNIDGEKNYKSSFEDRKEMIRLGLGSYASHVTILPARQSEKEGIVEKMKSLHGPVFKRFIGADSFVLLPPDVDRSQFKIFPRDLETSASSTKIRRQLALNLPTPDLPKEVRDYIFKKHLYNHPAPVLCP
jgi:nicotinic acid mononucleotide adenylyltransferase